MSDHETVLEAPPVARNPDGTFPKGVSGNPTGRPPGTKNKITLLRQSLELQLREQASADMSEVMQKAIELALEGNTAMIKLLLELHIAKQVSEDKEAKEKVEININADRPPEIKQTTLIDHEDIQDGEITEPAE